MKPSLPDALLAALSDYLAARIGLQFSKSQWNELERGIRYAAPDLGFADAAACVRSLLSTELTRSQIETLASYLTIGETYFFREPKSFAALENHILPQLIEARRQMLHYLRFWSAACCTGEEAFSLAILLDKVIPDLAEWRITITATDINPRFLRRAAAGTYNDWSFRGVDPAIKAKYFSKQADGSYSVIPRIRAMVTFAYHNLVEDPFPTLESNTNAMDVVLCRNVLMYFSSERAVAVVRHLYSALVDGGWLIPSSVEGAPNLFAPFEFFNTGGAILYRKPEPPSATKTAMTWTTAMSIAGAREVLPPTAAPQKVATPGTPGRSVDNTADPSQSLLQLAQILYGQGCYSEAAETLVQHLAAQPDDERAMTLLARACANLGRLAEAQQWCTEVISRDRLAAGNHYLLAMIQQECGDLSGAVASLRRALFLEPRLVLAEFALANVTRSQGKYLEARKHYRSTLVLLDGRNPDELLPESEGMTVGRLREIARYAALERA